MIQVSMKTIFFAVRYIRNFIDDLSIASSILGSFAKFLSIFHTGYLETALIPVLYEES